MVAPGVSVAKNAARSPSLMAAMSACTARSVTSRLAVTSCSFVCLPIIVAPSSFPRRCAPAGGCGAPPCDNGEPPGGALVRSAVGDRRRAGRQLAVGQRGPAAGPDLARPDGAHGGMETAGRGPAAGAAAGTRRRLAEGTGPAQTGEPRRMDVLTELL